MNYSGTWARVIGAAVCVACSGAAVAQSGNPDFSVPDDTKTTPSKQAPSKQATEPKAKPGREEGRQGLVDLRAKFREGMKATFKMVMENKNDLAGGEPGKPEQVVKQEIGLTLKVKSVSADGAAALELVYDSLKFDMQSDALDVSFDSSKPADKQDEFADLLKTIVGTTISMQADANGNITSVSGGGPATMPGIPGAISQQFTGGDVIKNFFGPIMTLQNGSGRVSVGESWTNEDTIAGGMGNFRMKNTYTLRSYRAPTANVDMSGTMSLDGSSTGPVDLREGTIKGRYVWDTEEGMLKSMEMTMRTVVNTKLTGDNNPTESRSESTVSVTRK